ncbi:hypothetical protein HJC23_008403 [Cyclotella cryptica]|uniref:SET domain-containing protein n=1 Tax=Cyclotella cryptica TaxID=29204 RepID=A0ABD3PYP9_9STRA|eukprot:CCRYP_010679-RA/>CCRYP_010679-RA protein AED:0.28 eAED:0.28 QI:0/-1/0/1/-1/1/1/0/310
MMPPSLSSRLWAGRRARALAMAAACCAILTTLAMDEQCNTAQGTPIDELGALTEYQRIYHETEQTKKEDLSLFNISSSSIHGRGVMLTRPVKKDTPIGIVFFEVEGDMQDYLYPSLGGYWHARGYITDGGTLANERMPVRAAFQRCDEMEKCQGITFQDPDEQFADPQAELPHTVVDVEFKDKVDFRADTENSWQSFLKHRENLSALFFPLGCSGGFLPNPPPSSLDPRLMIPCWPRYINHSCRPTAVVVKVPVEEGFVLPGVPWKKVMGAYQLVTAKDIDEGGEISLNYESFPSHMIRRVHGVDECDKL